MTHSKTNSDALNELIERNGLPVSVILLPQVYPGGDVDNSIRVNNFDINMANKRVVLARKKKALREKDKEKKEEQIVPEQLPGFFGDLTIDDIYTRIERTQSVAKQKSNDQNKKKVNQLKSKVSGCNTNAIKETKKDKPKIDNSFTSNNSTDFGDMSSECKEIARMSSGSTAILEEITKNECTVTIDDEYATAGSIQSCPQIPLPASEARDEAREQQNDFCTQKGNRNRMKKNENRGYRIISQTNFTNTRRPFVIIKSATAKEKTSHEPKEKKTDKTEPKHLDSTMANHNIRAVPQGGKTKRQNRRKDDTGEQVEKFGEFRLFQGQQMPVPRLLKLNKKGTSREPSGNPIFDCANGYSNQSSMQAEFAQPIDLSEMNEDFDFETNLALFKKIKISPSSSHIEKNGTSECSVNTRKKNFANDENILSDSSKVISWTQKDPRLNRNVNGSGRVSKERDKKTVSKNNYIPTNKGLNKNTANTGRKKQRQMAFDSDASNDKEQNHSSSNVHTYPSSEGYQPLCMYPPHPLLNQAMLSAMYQQQHFLHAQCVGGYQGVPISTIQQQQIQQGPSRQKTVLVINDPKTNQPVRMTVNEDLDDNAREHSHQQNNSDINIHNCGIQQGQQPFHYMPPVFPLPPEFSPQFLYAPALPLHPPVFNMMYYQHIYENLKFSVNSPDVNAYNIHHSQYLHGSQIPAEQSTVPSNNSNTYQTMESQREKSAIMLNSTQKANRKSTMEH
ncbi:CBR-EDC-3 protein [Ditylenchus destructor]|uniref:CBR-EDC-3 protein n=1 Tax=Ditylenchus destructor TaxID=166010 RepID=A0AAD4NIQ1_9BILA|nr:CBR-EDC-3 protein [Ditylenchus destructor]